MAVWELVVIILCCICCSGGIAWLLVDMHRQLKEWEQIIKKNKDYK